MRSPYSGLLEIYAVDANKTHVTRPTRLRERATGTIGQIGRLTADTIAAAQYPAPAAFSLGEVVTAANLSNAFAIAKANIAGVRFRGCRNYEDGLREYTLPSE